MSTYSFLDTNATIRGPGGSINLAAGAAAADEGVTVAAVGDRNVMQTGAGGEGQHSLIASTAALVTVVLLKTSPVNAQLMQMYNYQTSSSVLHGKNVLVVSDFARGDLVTLSKVAFKKVPDLVNAKEAGTNTWTFDAIRTNYVLGTGTPEL
jgi:hypothetical protein